MLNFQVEFTLSLFYSKNWLYQARGIPRYHFLFYLKETEFRFKNRE